MNQPFEEKRNMKQKLFAVLVIATLLLTACGGSGSGAQGTIKIGGGFALTGDESALDLPAANGAKLAVKEINASGGVNGQPLDLIVHDTQYKMDVTAQVAKQFVEQDKVAAVVGFT